MVSLLFSALLDTECEEVIDIELVVSISVKAPIVVLKLLPDLWDRKVLWGHTDGGYELLELQLPVSIRIDRSDGLLPDLLLLLSSQRGSSQGSCDWPSWNSCWPSCKDLLAIWAKRLWARAIGAPAALACLTLTAPVRSTNKVRATAARAKSDFLIFKLKILFILNLLIIINYTNHSICTAEARLLELVSQQRFQLGD